ncbi:Do family serine endopeptidase [Hyphomicrobium sp. LHD-15]|uniref:Do family serine endopeptidase n=1 Tax=Hyphomicrobium sp. LHD-15 TaxID=3072142 RepID=UPI00280F334B|nr:Do family serine endopeptidase [Hyphomicrobium sp. LHD-15]MDQ8697530.1 Do family serine endopeptidase [Hyphomicrobium sp. LHD-15]
MLRFTKQLAALVGAGALGILAATAFHGAATAQRADEPAPRAREVPPSREVAQYSFSPIVRRAAPAVVNVYVQRRVQTFSSPFANDPFFRQFFGDAFGQPSERIQSSLGSGVIVSPDGIVVTNTHVIRGRGETEIRIALADKREFDAKVLTQDDKTDIAILKIESNEQRFPILELEDSDTLEVGDMVLAIGNPFGVGQTVTSGIVSALARSEVGNSDSQVFIQTDAAINPGNSGGALVDMSGKLVGINTMIFSQSGGSQGIGFAIPSNLVRLYVAGAAEGRKVERPWLGARLETVTRELAEGLGLDRVAGAAVARVSDSGPAAKAGLLAGDVIVHIDGFEVGDARAVQYRLTTRGIGSTVKIGVIRKGQPQTVELTLVAAPTPGRDDVRNLAGQHPLDGARVSNIVPGVADELGLDEAEGVVVLSVRRQSTAARYGFLPGDIIVQVGQAPVSTVTELEELLTKRQRVWLVAVRRGDKVFNLQVPG